MSIRIADNGIHPASEAELGSFDTLLRFQSGDQTPLDREGSLPSENTTCGITVSQADTHLRSFSPAFMRVGAHLDSAEGFNRRCCLCIVDPLEIKVA